MSIFNKHRIFCPRALELRRIAAGIAAGVVFSLCGVGIYAQQIPVMPGFGTAKQIPDEQRTINNVNVNIEGKQNVSKEAVYAHIRLRKGMKFDQRALDQSIRSIYSTGFYDFVDAKRSVDSNGNLDIDFTIIPKYRVSQIAFSGNKTFSGARLQKEIDTYAGAPLSEVAVKRDADKIKAYYQKKGYSLAKVNYSIERNDDTGVGAVVFDIDEGGDIEIQNIRFTGDSRVEKQYGFWSKIGRFMFGEKDKDFDSVDLLSEMKTDTWIPLISHLTDNGRFKEEDFQADIEKLRKFYRDHGYLDVEIDDSKIKFEFPDEDAPGDMDIVINIVPNHQYKVGKVSFKGNTLEGFSDSELMKFVDYFDLTEGNVFSPSKVDKLIEQIREYYGQYGYIDTIVRVLRRPNVNTDNIDLIIDIIESKMFYLESINIQGNDKTKSEVIIREIAMEPGAIFDLRRMKISENRLKETRFFDEVTLSPEDTNIPQRKNLRIAVKEGRTGNLTFGAGFSTVESLVATVEVTQSNFDYSNYNNYFQGAGQKFRVRGTIGLESNQIIISFEEPWVFNRELAYGIDLYRTDSDYYSDYYSEMRLGVTNYLRKRIYGDIEARLAYKLELVDIYNVDNKIRGNVIPEQDIGSRSLSQISLSFLRDTRDSYMTPTRGTRLELIQDLAGGPLMGQTNLYRIEARAGWWIPTFDFGKQVFSIVGRTGTVQGYGGKDVPYFERFFLGGGYNMRGFKYRKVGKLDPTTEEPLGGNTFAFVSAEYSIELFNPVRFAVFYDIGFVNSDSWDWNPSDYCSDFGFGFRVLLMGAPMRIDLGFPLKADEYNDDGMQFNFSFGTVF